MSKMEGIWDAPELLATVTAERDAAIAERAEYAEVTAALRAENQALRERLARVEALRDEWSGNDRVLYAFERLTAALGEPAE